MDWRLKEFHEISAGLLYRLIQARVDVFVVEQACVYRELDDLDLKAYHLYAEVEEEIVAYLRILPPGLSYETEVSIGRVLVMPKWRQSGLAREMITEALDFIEKEIPEIDIKIQAQAYLQGFYHSFGFKVISDLYDDEGIPHIDMLLSGK